MPISRKASRLTTLALASAIALGAYLMLMYKAGCAGDLKSGTSGDAQRTLLLEAYGTPCMILGTLLASTFAFIIAKPGATSRVAFSALIFLVVGTLMIFAGIQLEIWGNQACFQH